MSFKAVDTIDPDYLEPGDFIQSHEGSIIQIKGIESVDGGYVVSHLDDFEDELESFFIGDNDIVNLYVYTDDDQVGLQLYRPEHQT